MNGGSRKIVRLGMSVEEAGKAIGLGRNSAYEAAQRGDIPTIKIGRRLIVPIEAFREMLRVRVTKARPPDTSAVSAYKPRS